MPAQADPLLGLPWIRRSVHWLEYLQKPGKIVSRDCSIRLPPVPPADKAQQPDDPGPYKPSRRGPRGWMRWIAGTSGSDPQPQVAPGATDKLSVHASLRELPARLDCSSLPNGVVELLIEDLEAPMSHVFDIHDGHITLAAPGQCVPWASIAGPPTAWALALGPDRNVEALQLTGDKQLAQRVLAAFPPPS